MVIIYYDSNKEEIGRNYINEEYYAISMLYVVIHNTIDRFYNTFNAKYIKLLRHEHIN